MSNASTPSRWRAPASRCSRSSTTSSTSPRSNRPLRARHQRLRPSRDDGRCSLPQWQAGRHDSGGLRLELELDAEVPIRRRGDGRRLRQILLNLVSNAVASSPDGFPVSVRVGHPEAVSTPRWSASRWPTPASASMRRACSGCSSRSLRPTRRRHATTVALTRPRHTARELVEMMGGDDRRRQRGREREHVPGSRSRSGAAEAAELGRLLTRPARRGGRRRGPVLRPLPVAEASQINQIVAARALERCGCRTHVVGDGLEALKALETQRYDAVPM